ncbi:MAG TPA: carotenoid biosynthesis protein [Candidatus Angelobacter sp.]|nr:carotenoid biosynthesis protein [Candidatus Angelobacter sp.]
MQTNENQTRFLLMALLLLYLVSRVLQLFAGQVPNLLIVILHVIPAALFAAIHGGRTYRSRDAVVFIGLCLAVGCFFESVSLRTGFPFGHYRFTDLMGPKLLDLPIMLALAYVGMGYSSWILGLIIMQSQDQRLSGKNLVVVPLVASCIMTIWDFSMDPIWADIDHAWVWRDGGSFYGVPPGNFFGWFLTTYVFYQLFALYIRNRKTVPAPASHWRLAILLYALSAAGNLFVVAPASLGDVFVDATGKRWLISSILWACRLISVFVMLPLGLLAWVRASRSVKPCPEQVTQFVSIE